MFSSDLHLATPHHASAYREEAEMSIRILRVPKMCNNVDVESHVPDLLHGNDTPVLLYPHVQQVCLASLQFNNVDPSDLPYFHIKTGAWSI